MTTFSTDARAEYDAVPVAFITSDLRNEHDHLVKLHKMEEGQELEHALRDYGLLEAPNPLQLETEYNGLLKALGSFSDVKVYDLAELVGDTEEYRRETASSDSLNLSFTRDPATTIPWAPELFIPSSMSLASRRGEVEVMSTALSRIGMRAAINFDPTNNELVEGGDMLPTVHDGERTLMIGIGERTRLNTALKIADQLLGEVFDVVYAVQHDMGVLHLDTGYLELPERTVLMSKNMFLQGMRITQSASGVLQKEDVPPQDFLENRGYRVINVEREDAIEHEACNLVPAGNKRFISFEMDAARKKLIEDTTGVVITEVSGSEISKLTGGVHCLTRNVYTPIKPHHLVASNQ